MKSTRKQLTLSNFCGEILVHILMLDCISTVEAQFLHSDNVSIFTVWVSSPSFIMSLLKVLCGYSTCQFKSPFDGIKVHLIVCPSHQVGNSHAIG